MAASQGKVAKRYARALFEACQPANLEEVRGVLKTFTATWAGNAGLQEAMVNPAIPLEQRVNVITEIGKTISSRPEITSFLSLLVSNHRITALPQISEAFSKLVDEVQKLLALEISSAFPLSDSERSAVMSRIQKDFGSAASIQWHVDRSLIGGVTVKSGDKLLDGSVKGSLERIRTVLQA